MAIASDHAGKVGAHQHINELAHRLAGSFGADVFQFFFVLFPELCAFCFDRRLLFCDDPVDRFLDVEILDSGQLLERAPVVQAIAAGKHQGS